MTTARSRFMTARLRMPQAGDPASFPRVIMPANPAIALPAAALPPVDAFDPPIQPAVPQPAALPAQGVAADVEARTIDQVWPQLGGLLTGQEVTVYTTVKQWPALDVYIQDLNLIRPGECMTVRVYALSAQGPATLVASGRYGHYSLAAGGGGQALRVPVWIAAARNQTSRFQVSIQLEGTTGAFSGQFTSVTIVGSARSDVPPAALGAIRIGRDAAAGPMLTKLDAELLMVSGVLGAAVATPRYLHVHQRSGAIAGFAPAFSFPLGAGVAALGGGGFGGEFWFPPGMRPQGPVGFYQVVGSSVANTTTAAADVFVQGLFR